MDGFPLFSRLPAELRRMIWLCTLPEEDVPALVPYDDKAPYESFSDIHDEEELTGEDIADERAFWEEQLGQATDEPASENDDEAQNGGPSMTVRAAARRMLAEAIEADEDAMQVGNAAQEMGEFNGNGTLDDGAEWTQQGLSDNEESEERSSNEGEGSDSEEEEEEEEEESEDEEEMSDEDQLGSTAGQGPKALSRPWIPVQLPPLVLVNREARQTMLDYIDSKNWAIIRNKISKDEVKNGFTAGDPVFIRRYNPQHDALWVDRLHWPVFLDHLLGSKNREGADIVTLAVPAFTAYHSVMTLSELFYDMPHLKRVVCIWGELPPDEWVPEQVNGMDVLRRGDGEDAADDGDDDEVQLVLWERWEAQKVGSEDGVSEQTAAGSRERPLLAEATDWSDLDNPEDILQDQTMVRMCVRDPMDRGDTFEEGVLGEYMNEIYEVLNAMTLRSGALGGRLGSLGSVPFLAREAVCRG